MSLYETGTITGALNSTTISGTGTKWSDAKIGITNGSVLFVSSSAGIDGVYQIKRVINDTSIELAQPIYKAFTNAKYSILVAEASSTASFANQLAAALGYYQAQIDGWQQIMTGTGDVALTAPDGTKVTIKSFTALDKNKADVKDIQKLEKDKMNVGDFGLGGSAQKINYANLVQSGFVYGMENSPELGMNYFGINVRHQENYALHLVGRNNRFFVQTVENKNFLGWKELFTSANKPTANDVEAWPIAIRGMISNGGTLSSANQTGVYLISVSDPTTVADFPKNNNVPLYGYGFVVVNKNGATLNQLYMNHRGHMANRQSWNNEAGYSGWNIVYGTVNTTVDSSGFIKRASPIVKIFGDGGSELNPESEGVKVNRESVGVYRISGVLGMNSDGAWGGIDGGFEIPTDRNGQRLLWLDYEVEADGSILVKTYHRTYPDAPAFARNIKEGYEEGDLIDIPSDQFVSVRVEMPQDSIWNLAQKAAQEEMEQEKTTEE
ncbi:phage tail fiber protein [Hafnia paralvei]|uniref:phage tail fiber protein n=1 Tax=Hafnia paralvei TaxID=546367 RepID=UPI001CB9529B|nr:hypothetical protein [Hafnia paralvei]